MSVGIDSQLSQLGRYDKSLNMKGGTAISTSFLECAEQRTAELAQLLGAESPTVLRVQESLRGDLLGPVDAWFFHL